MDSASRSVRQWLTALDLAQYLPHFVAQDIDGAVLALLTDGDLRELGIASMGHRKRLLKAIAESVRAGDLLTPALAQDLPMSRPETDVTSALSAASAPEPERRQLTVIFCDLVDSTALSTRLDPEDLRQVVRRYHRLASSVIERFGGFPAQFMGDGVMAFSDGAAYNPSTDSWRPLSAGYAHPGFSPVWTGDRLVLFAKGGAVVYGSADDRQAERDVDASTKAGVFQYRQTLIVIHRQHRIATLQL